MEYRECNVSIKRDNPVSLVFDNGLSNLNLSEETSSDIELFFNELFNSIMENKQLVTFVLQDEDNNDLFHDVAKDIINQINSEIALSEDSFNRILSIGN